MFYNTSTTPLVGMDSPVRPPEQMLGSLSKLVLVMPQLTAPLSQLFYHPSDFDILNGMRWNLGSRSTVLSREEISFCVSS